MKWSDEAKLLIPMSARNLDLVITAPAIRDFRNLLALAEQQWGRKQRDRYKVTLDHALLNLTSFPELGRSRDDSLPEMRQIRAGEHIIYYRHDDQSVTVLRILHRRMNPERHLPASE